MRFGSRIFLVFVALPFLASVPAAATTLTYSTYSAWNANVTGGTELNFNGITLSANYGNSTGKTLYPIKGSALPFVFTGPLTAGGYQLTGGDYGASNAISLLGATGGKGNITVNLPSGGENAILLGLGSTGNASTITVTLSDGQVFNVSATANTYEFLGLSLSHDISWLTVSTSTQPVINDFYFANSKLAQDPQAPASAEAATFGLIGAGLLMLIGGRRKFFPASLSA